MCTSRHLFILVFCWILKWVAVLLAFHFSFLISLIFPYLVAYQQGLDFDSHHHFLLEQVDELLKQRDNIHSSFTIARSATIPSASGHFSNGSTSKFSEDYKSESAGEEGSSDSKDKSSKKKWFGIHLKGSDKK